MKMSTTMETSVRATAATRARGRRRGRTRWTVVVMVAIVASVAVLARGTRANVDGRDATGGDGARARGVAGAVGDAACDVEEVERANEAQLHSILSELTNTTYFRLFQVDLKRTCKFWGSDDGGGKTRRDGDASDAEPSCSAPKSPFGEEEEDGASSAIGAPPKTMCSLDLEHKDGVEPMLWSPLTDSVDRTISTPEARALTSIDEPETDCSDEELPTFWMDMCHKFAPEEQTEYVNLQLNPERWTGYNGSHVWRAIYEENCLKSALNVDDMCYEERVLYRLLSGMHSSINIHIALNSKPPKRAAGETEWGSDPKKFVEIFAKHPDRLKNLHFSFVVLLRALRKAAPALSRIDVRIGQDAEEDLRTQALMSRLLESHILSSCRDVFGAFDEKSLFRDVQSTLNMESGTIGGASELLAPVSLKSQFKDIFLNISEVMDCISCQKCKLHGKLQLLGLGTALKVLLLPEDLLESSLNRQEVVALINTIAKFSHAIRKVPDLMNSARREALQSSATSGRDFTVDEDAGSRASNPLDAAIAALATHVKSGVLAPEMEDAIMGALLEDHPKISVLAKYYAESMPLRFVEHSLRALGKPPLATGAGEDEPVDLVVVGGGLAGLTASLTVLDRGGRVTLVEKEAYVGGNSQWASSGINGVIKSSFEGNPDSVDAYADDCEKSSFGNGNGRSGLDPETVEHIPTLTSKAGQTIEWLRRRVGADLTLLSRLGGHSHARTYRPTEGMAGSSLVFALKGKCEEYLQSGRFKIVKKARVTAATTDSNGRINGVRWAPSDDDRGRENVIKGRHVLLATGGYSNDKVGDDALLNKFAPHLAKFATTNTKGTTGDGHKLAFGLGAGAVDMQRVQVHPTGFINPEDETAGTKTLAAELLRGAGGILLTRSGERFANELGTRDYVSARMQEMDPEKLDFVLLLNEKGANEANKHVPLYMKKNLMTKFDSLADLATWMASRGDATEAVLRATLEGYNANAVVGRDVFNKTFFANVPFDLSGPFYAGRVTPVVHYTMGGVKVDSEGRVLRPDGSRVDGLFAAGEIIGGVHGKNRLGGNALTECAVFGRLVGASVVVEPAAASAAAPTPASKSTPKGDTAVTRDELAKHASASDCWVALYGKVYDFTDFLEDHPAGADAILRYGGGDGTNIFEAVHSKNMLDDFEPIGKLVD